MWEGAGECDGRTRADAAVHLHPRQGDVRFTRDHSSPLHDRLLICTTNSEAKQTRTTVFDTVGASGLTDGAIF